MVWSLVFLLSCGVQLTFGVKFPVIGDWGDILDTGKENQRLVAQRLAEWCDYNRCDFIFSTGDNFYNEGVTSPTDERFDSSWKNVYNQPSIANLKWYQSIGNHDHDQVRPGDGREVNQVLYGLTEARWVFPDRWYDFVVQDPSGFSIHFVVIDTQSLRWDINNPAAQLQYLDDTLAASTSEWKVVVAHHPPYSAGRYGPIEPVIDEGVVPIVKRHGVQLMLLGHDHNLQHIQSVSNPNEVNYFISGAGGRALYPLNQDNVDVLTGRGLAVGYFGFTHGFSYLEFSATAATISNIDSNGFVAYRYTRGVSTAAPGSE